MQTSKGSGVLTIPIEPRFLPDGFLLTRPQKSAANQGWQSSIGMSGTSRISLASRQRAAKAKSRRDGIRVSTPDPGCGPVQKQR
jgi:hypothetical protein